MKAFQGSSSGLFSDNTESPLGHLNGTLLYFLSSQHWFTLILSLFFISAFSLLFQEAYSSEIFIIVSSVHLLGAIFVPLPFLIILSVPAEVNEWT